MSFQRARLQRLEIAPSELSPTILVVGGGYGREVDWILENSRYGFINIIEKSSVLAAYLADKYSDRPRVRVFHQDLLTITPQFRDEIGTSSLVLVDWSTIFEILAQDERKQAFTKLYELTGRPGALVVETKQDPQEAQPYDLRHPDHKEELWQVQYGNEFNLIKMVDTATLEGLARNAHFDTSVLPLLYTSQGSTRAVRIELKPGILAP